MLDRADLLAYAHGEYYALGERVERFGHSATKKKPIQKSAPMKIEKKKSREASDDRSEEKKRPFYLDAPGYKRGKRK